MRVALESPQRRRILRLAAAAPVPVRELPTLATASPRMVRSSVEILEACDFLATEEGVILALPLAYDSGVQKMLAAHASSDTESPIWSRGPTAAKRLLGALRRRRGRSAGG